MALVIGSVKYDPEPLALYRQHDANSSGPQLETKNAVAKILHKTFLDRRPEYEAFRTAAANRAQILRTLSRISPNAEADNRIKNAGLMYTNLHESLERRRSLYTTRSISKRMRILISSVNNGDCQIGNMNGWKYGMLGFIRDCIYALAYRKQN